ncbi:hypothetical protein [Rhizobium sp. Nf11,1]|uniref:hypothetical protein n=1 Tax=unclassified Rhizobium TaxID=2613769 RepID=UPI003D359291
MGEDKRKQLPGGFTVFGQRILRSGPDRQSKKHTATLKRGTVIEPSSKAGMSIVFDLLREPVRISDQAGCDRLRQMPNSERVGISADMVNKRSQVGL